MTFVYIAWSLSGLIVGAFCKLLDSSDAFTLLVLSHLQSKTPNKNDWFLYLTGLNQQMFAWLSLSQLLLLYFLSFDKLFED